MIAQSPESVPLTACGPDSPLRVSSYDTPSMGQSGRASDTCLFFDLGQVAPLSLSHNILICRIGMRITPS